MLTARGTGAVEDVLVPPSRTDGPPSHAAGHRQCYLSAGDDITAPTTAVGNRRAFLSWSAGVVIISRKATVPLKHASFYESLSNKSVKSVRFGGVPRKRHHATARV